MLGDLETMLRRIREFLDEPFDPAILAQNVLPIEERVHRIAAFRPYSRRYNGQPVIVKDNVNKWNANLTLDERILFESVAGELLEDLGYETEGHQKTHSGLCPLGMDGALARNGEPGQKEHPNWKGFENYNRADVESRDSGAASTAGKIIRSRILCNGAG